MKILLVIMSFVITALEIFFYASGIFIIKLEKFYLVLRNFYHHLFMKIILMHTRSCNHSLKHFYLFSRFFLIYPWNIFLYAHEFLIWANELLSSFVYENYTYDHEFFNHSLKHYYFFSRLFLIYPWIIFLYAHEFLIFANELLSS